MYKKFFFPYLNVFAHPQRCTCPTLQTTDLDHHFNSTPIKPKPEITILSVESFGPQVGSIFMQLLMESIQMLKPYHLVLYSTFPSFPKGGLRHTGTSAVSAFTVPIPNILGNSRFTVRIKNRKQSGQNCYPRLFLPQNGTKAAYFGFIYSQHSPIKMLQRI